MTLAHYKKFFYYILLVSVFSLVSCTEKIPTLPKLANDAVIVAFGDSLTYGTGVKAAASYPSVLQTISDHTVINAGVPGELSAQGVVRLVKILDKYSPALLILCHGGNDLLRKKSKLALRQNLIKMIKQAQQRDISVILIGVPQPKLAFMQTAPLYKEIAKQFKIPAELNVVLRVESDQRLKSDAVHPNKPGYRQIAESVHQLLLKSGTL